MRPRPTSPHVGLHMLRSGSASLANRSRSALRVIPLEQRLRLLVIGVAVVAIGAFAAVVAAVALPAVGNGSATPSPSSVASATATPHPTPVRPPEGVAKLRVLIETNAYLVQDHLALETVLATKPVSTADVVSLLRQIALHVRVANEALERVSQPASDEAVVVALAALYAQIATDTSAALAVTVSDAAAYATNGTAIAGIVAAVVPLTAELQVLVDSLVGAAASPGPAAAPSGTPGAPSSPAPSAAG